MGFPPPRAAIITDNAGGMYPNNHVSSDHGQFPQYQGRDLYEWVEQIADLKRAGQLDQAEQLARGCMDAMTAHALKGNPAMEHYVIELAIIQRKRRDYRAEVDTISRWLALELPAERDDHRLNLRKRLAKAQELLARQEGRDPSPWTQEWRKLCELEKKPSSRKKKGTNTGRKQVTSASSYRFNFAQAEAALATLTYSAIDFETATRSRVSACKIAVVCVENGRVTKRFSTLLRPPQGTGPWEFTYLHGIAPEHVRNAPTWRDVAGHVSALIAGGPVWAHNASFDSLVWQELDAEYGTVSKPKMLCTYRTAQRLLPGLPNYKLPTVTAAVAPTYRLAHHQAESDAEACAMIVQGLRLLYHQAKQHGMPPGPAGHAQPLHRPPHPWETLR